MNRKTAHRISCDIIRGGFPLAFALSLIMLEASFIPQRAQAIDKGKLAVEIGVTTGSKAGLLLGIKYFVVTDLAIGLDVFGSPVGQPVGSEYSGFVMGASAELSYYPDALVDLGYIGTGLSYLFRSGANKHIVALNGYFGANTVAFEERVLTSQDEYIPTVIYLELGFGYALFDNKSSENRFIWPNVELGLRQGNLY